MTSPYLDLLPRAEPEVRRARLKASLEATRAQGRAEGVSDALIDEANRDALRAFDNAEVARSLFELFGPGLK